MSRRLITRRILMRAAPALLLTGCDQFSRPGPVRNVLTSAEGLTMRMQRLLQGAQPLAREFQEKDLSPVFKANGSTAPRDPNYGRMMEGGFADWRLDVGGLVQRRLSLSLEDLKALPSRTQITRHDCVEGWSAIGKWKGVPLATVLHAAGLAPGAGFIVFRCADDMENSKDGSGLYYESIDLVDAFHPQTILAYEMNGEPLAVPHGAPLRLRVERQLGYKHAKYLMRIEVVRRLDTIGRGKGGYWEDRGYEWYAGI